MRTARIGSLEVSVIGLGCNNFGRALDEAGSVAVVRAALDAGMTFFDTAGNYGEGRSESYLRAGLGNHRGDAVIATKFGLPVAGVPGSGGARPEYVRRALERSLSELGTDYVDLYQLHFPDPATPIEETLGAMHELREEGKVREIGCSNLDASQLRQALRISADRELAAFVSNQVQYSLVHREPETNGVEEVCVRSGVALLPFYPLACGLLTGKTRRGEQPQGRLRMDRYREFLSDENFDLVASLERYARSRGVTMVQVALGWLLSREVVPAVTAGATTPEQVAGNAAAARWVPSSDDLTELEEALDAG